MVELRQIPAHRLDEIVNAVEEDGACIARDVLPVALCEQLLTDFAPHLAVMQWGVDELGYRDDFYGSRTKRLHGLFSKSPHMAEVLTHPLFLGLAQQLFVEPGIANDIRLSNTELMVLAGDQPAQAFHTDAGSWRRIQQSEGNEILVSANCALTEFTARNGATRVVPGSHRWPAERVPKQEEVGLAVMPKGAALIYSGNTIHSGGANQERITRTGLYLGYVVSWLRPIENQLVTNDPADIHRLPEVARRLLDVVPGGFTVHA